MTDDDNSLADLDLTAWAPPPPPPDLADAVIDRMRQAAAASPVTTAIANPTSSRRWWLAGGLAVAATAALILIVIGGRTREDGSGSVVADRPRHLELDGVTADLDQGAEIRWRRDRGGVHVEQRRGAVTWHVADDEHLVIAAGATVASVEASGASLRVEVQMNQSDARVIGMSAVTAAAVALVTVVVYDGHVRVGKDGSEAVAVAAGTTVEVQPKQAAPDRVAETECQPLVDAKRWSDLAECARGLGTTARGSELAAIAAGEQAAELKLVALRDALAIHRIGDAKRIAAQIPSASVYSDEAGRAIAGACDIEALRTQAGEAFSAGRFAAALVAYDNAWACTNDARDARLAYFAACRARDLGKARFFLGNAPRGQTAAMVATCSLDPKLEDCDPDPHRQAGDSEAMAGNHAAALSEYEKALACTNEEDVIVQAYEAACRSNNAAKARVHYDRLSATAQQQFASVCTDLGIRVGMHTVDPSLSASPPNCDAAALHQDGQDAFTTGRFALALAKFEAAYKCKPDGSLVRLMYMAACRSRSFSKAKTYLAMNPQAQQVALARICLQEGFDPLRP